MVVDATFPTSARKAGMVVNEDFIMGENQRIAAKPLESWVIPPEQDAQAIKDQLLKKNFTPAELEFREIIIAALSSGAILK